MLYLLYYFNEKLNYYARMKKINEKYTYLLNIN